MNLRVVVVVLSSFIGIAGAQPKPAPAKSAVKAPPPKPVCAPSAAQTRMALVGNEPVACFLEEEGKPETCLTSAVAGTSRFVATPPKATKEARATEVRDDGGKPSACAGAKCVKLGKKLVAAIAKVKQTAAGDEGMGIDPTPYVSADLKLVALDGKAWSVKGDKVLKLTAPVEYKENKLEKPTNLGFEIVGNFGVSTWSNCAGPCGYSVVTDTAGKNKGPWFPAGFYVTLDDKRLVVVPSDADSQLTVIDPVSGKQLHTLQLGDGVLESMSAVKVDASNLGLVWFDGTGWTVANVGMPEGAKPTLTKRTIPACP